MFSLHLRLLSPSSESMAFWLAQRDQLSFVWMAFSLPVRQLPLAAAAGEPLRKTVTNCPSSMSLRSDALLRVDLRVSAHQDLSLYNQWQICC